MQFTPKEPNLGFDAGSAGSMPWQMVPAGGARGLKLSHATKLDITIEPVFGSGASDGLTFSETELRSATNREIWLQGRSAGQYLVGAGRSGVPVAPLEAEVFEERLVKIAFYIMPDVRGHWDVSKLTDMANAIWFPQANVRLAFLNVWTPESATTTFQVDGLIDLSRSDQRVALQAYGNNWDADLLVYFGGKKIVADKGYSTNAQTGGNKTYVDTTSHSGQDYTQMSRTLAHEIGHFVCPDSVGHDGKATDLMFANAGKKRGTQIRRARVRQVIR